jgi:hypothetical protein
MATKSFSQYLAEAKAKQAKTRPVSVNKPVDFSAFKQQPKNKPQDPLSWVIDIASRPLYTVTETIQSGFEWAEKANSGKDYDVAAEAAKTFTAPVRGFFSTNKDDKPMTSDLIEQGTDIIGKSTDPRYKDVKDNVNPWVKGIGGFVGDVALDPLTYVPLGFLVSGGKKLLQGAKAGADAVSTGVATANAAKKGPKPTAVSEAVKTSAKVKLDEAQKIADEAKVAQESGVGADVVTPAEASRASEIMNTQTPKVNKTKIDLEKTVNGPPPTVYDLLKTNKQTRAVKSTLKKLIEPIEGAPVSKAAVKAAAKGPVAFKNVKEFKQGYLDEVAAGAEDVMIKVGDIDQPLSQVVNAQGTVAKKALTEHFQRHSLLYSKTGGRVDAANRLVNTDGITPSEFLYYKAVMDPEWTAAKTGSRYVTAREIVEMAIDKNVAPSEFAPLVAQAADLMPEELTIMAAKNVTNVPTANPKEAPKIDPFSARFRSSLDSGELKKVEGILGEKLTANLRRRTGAGSFEGTVNSLLKLMNNERSLNNIVDNSDLSTIDRDLMNLIGIDVAGTNLARRQDISNIGVPNRKAEINEAWDEGMSGETVLRLSGYLSDESAELIPFFDSIAKRFPDIFGIKRRTKTGAAVIKADNKTGKTFKREREFNTRDFWTLLKDLTINAAKMADSPNNPLGRKMTYRERSEFVKQRVMRQIAVAEAVLDQMGIPLWLGVSDGLRVQLSLSQAVSVLNKIDPDLVNIVLFNGGTRTITTNILDAIASVVRVDSKVPDEEIAGSLKNSEYGNDVYNAFVRGGRYGFDSKKKGTTGKISANKLTAEMVAALRTATPELRQIVADNILSYKKRFNNEAADLTNDVLDRFAAFVNTPGKVADAIKVVDDYANQIKKTGDSSWVMDLSQIAAKIGVSTRLPFGAEVSGKSATRVRRTAQASEKKAPPKATPQQKSDKIQKDVQEDLKAPADEAAKISDEAYQSNSEFGRETVEDAAATKAHGAVMTDTIRRMNPLMSMFSRHHGMENISDVIHSLSNGFKELRGNFTNRLNKINKEYSGLVDGFGVSKITKVFQEIQRNIPSDAADAGLRTRLEEVVSELFDHTQRNSLSDLQNIGGIGPDVFVDYLKQVKIQEVIGRDKDAIFDLEKFNKMVKDGEAKDMWDAMAKEWTTMKIDDPIDFLGRWQGALIMANTDGALTHGALAQFRKMPGAVSKTKAAGYVKLDQYGGKLSAFLPSNTYVREDLANEFQRMSEFVSEARVAGGKFGEILQKTYYPVQDTWKYAITLPRPGHHIRNIIGDMSLTFMAEGVRFARRSSTDAFKLMYHGRKGASNYGDIDLLAALRNEKVDKLPVGTDVMSSGKYGDLNVDELYNEAAKRGLLPRFFISEDIEATAQGKLKKVLDKAALRGGKIESGLGIISEGRDHFARFQHFMQFIHKAQKPGRFDPKFTSKEEMFAAAAVQVKKYHPDASMLTPFEARTMRPLIPFYSWLRGAMPAVIVSAAIRPGRALVFPKASYNLAVAMGVDPNSLSDPFPEDQLFPQFIDKRATGPVAKFDGKYYTINPGIANIDVSNEFGTDPYRALLGMISPILRMPIELSTGSKLDTGSRIKDASEYVDSNIPGINYLSNFSGYSATGSLVGILSGQGPDIQRAIEKGTKTDTDRVLSFVNYMTGLGIGNVSKQNLIDLAEIEKRNREGEQRAGY